MTKPKHQDRGSGAFQRRPEPRYLAIGRVARPFGLRGELRVTLLTEYPEQLGRLRTVFLGSEEEPWAVERVRPHRDAAVFKLAGCDDRNAAEALRGAVVQIAREDAVPLEEWQRQLLDERLDDLDKNPGAGIPWADVQAQVLRKLSKKPD